MQDELQVTTQLLEEYIEARRAEGLANSSLKSYERMLWRLYAMLPADKILRPDMLPGLAERMNAEGYAPRTLNVFLAATEGLMKHAGVNAPKTERQNFESVETPEISRSEYLKLLAAAKKMGKPRTYYLIKCFAVLGINLRDVNQVTVEAVETGMLSSSEGMVRIPEEFRKELGPLFRGRDGEPIHRTNINKSIVTVGSHTKLPPEKYTPRALRRLCERTQEDLEDKMRFLIDREYDHILVKENLTTGWHYR